MGDSGRLRQILLNLLGNAVKFTERGEVVVHARLESRTETESVIHFTVSDTGIGIPPEKQLLIFDPFTQADGSTTRRYGGTGLGLTISSRLAGLMGGNLWVESEVWKGSHFHFRVRLGTTLTSRSKSGRSNPARLRGMAALIVDDNATNRRILEHILRNWDMRPASVAGGAEALAELRRAAAAGEPYSLILLDMMMPEMDGLTLAEHIKAQSGLAGVTIMMLTSANCHDDVERCRRLGVDAYLVKPIRPSDLQSAILSALAPEPVNGEAVDRPRQGGAAQEAARPTRQLRLLLAEDNLVNQRVTVRMLEQQGHTVVVATNGKEALAALERESFDLVLMDVQMPEMGGFEATDAIRKQELTTGRHIPIVALTAHAMKGDRERCLNAGMDGYVSKPIRGDELWTEMGRLLDSPLEPTPRQVDHPAPEPVGARETVLDRAELLRRIGTDRETLREVAILVGEECPRLLGAVRAALDRGVARDVERAAHSLKGTVGIVAARQAHGTAYRLENLAHQQDLVAAEVAYLELETQLSRLQDALTAMVGEEQP